jgi:hypothetical protein
VSDQTAEAREVWASHVAQLRDSGLSHALGITFALAAEVFAQKAELKRLRLALAAAGGVSPEQELAAGESASFADWLRREQTEFARQLFKSWSQTDQSPDVSDKIEVG